MTHRKFWDIDHPPVVVLVGSQSSATDVVRSLRARGVEVDVREWDRDTTTASDADRRPDTEPAASLDSEPDPTLDLRIETVRTGAAALERLETRPRVECLWTPQELPDTTGLELAAAARERDSVVGLVLAPSSETGSEALAGEATAVGVTAYVPSDASPADRAERLETELDRALDRRHHAEKSGVLDAFLSELEISIYAKDEQARHVLFADVIGNYDPEVAFGRTDLELYPTTFEDVQNAYEDDRRVIETGEPVYDRLERQSQGSDYTWSRTTKVPWTVDGEKRGLVGITTDVSEFKSRERKLLRQVARLEQFPGYITHDLKTPLQIAQGYLGLAKTGDEEAIERVEEALERMEELIADFQSMASQETDSESGVQPVRLRPLAARTWESLDTASATLECALDSETSIVANEAQLRPLFENLFKNAVSHAGPDVTVRVGTLEDGFYVEDDGPGIPPGERDAVLDYGYTTSSEGSGLGLSIVMETVMTHDWQCVVTESDDGGARFEFYHCLVGTPLSVTTADADADADELTLEASTDVGDVELAGSAKGNHESGRYQVVGAGENIWGETNEFHYCYTTVEGGVRIQGRLAHLEGPYEYSKAGFMVRSSLDEDAAYGFVGGTPDHGPEVLWRADYGGLGYSSQFSRPEHEYDWFRLDRLGDQLCWWVSTDGESWEVVHRRSISLPETVTVGIAVCSVVPESPCEAIFEDATLERIESGSA